MKRVSRRKFGPDLTGESILLNSVSIMRADTVRPTECLLLLENYLCDAPSVFLPSLF